MSAQSEHYPGSTPPASADTNRSAEYPLRSAFVTGGSGFVGRELVRQLLARGVTVRALARSDAAAATVAALGAEPVRGDLLDAAALASGMRAAGGAPCDTVFHIAGHLDVWGPAESFRRTNVQGTEVVVAAARAACVPALVSAGAAAVLMEGTLPLLDADEHVPRSWALGAPAWAPYIATKAEAEARVRAANAPALRTVVVHPPAIWGAGDPYTLPGLVKAVRRHQLVWVSHPGARGGRYPYATCHVENVCEGLICAALRGRGGEAYLVTDGPEPDGASITFRDWVEGMLGAIGVRARAPSLPFGAAWASAAATEGVWRALRLPGIPPITRVMLRMIGIPFTMRDDRARRELGYVGRTARAAGLAAMRAAAH